MAVKESEAYQQQA